MASYSIEIDISKTMKGLSEMTPRIAKGIATAIAKSAYLVERYAKIKSPVDTGRLRSSVAAADIYPTVAYVDAYVNYAIYVHEGTRYMTGRPFMKEGLEQATNEIQGFFDDEIRKAIT